MCSLGTCSFLNAFNNSEYSTTTLRALKEEENTIFLFAKYSVATQKLSVYKNRS